MKSNDVVCLCRLQLYTKPNRSWRQLIRPRNTQHPLRRSSSLPIESPPAMLSPLPSHGVQVRLSVPLYACLLVCPSVCSSVCLPPGLSICLSLCISVCLPVGLSICLSLCVFSCWFSICLDVCFSFLIGCFCLLIDQVSQSCDWLIFWLVTPVGVTQDLVSCRL